MANAKYADLIRMNTNSAWNMFTYKTSHSLKDVLSPGYFNIPRERFHDSDIITVWVRNPYEHVMVELMVVNNKDEKIRVQLISTKDLTVDELEEPAKQLPPPPEGTRVVELLKPGVK